MPLGILMRFQAKNMQFIFEILTLVGHFRDSSSCISISLNWSSGEILDTPDIFLLLDRKKLKLWFEEKKMMNSPRSSVCTLWRGRWRWPGGGWTPPAGRQRSRGSSPSRSWFRKGGSQGSSGHCIHSRLCLKCEIYFQHDINIVQVFRRPKTKY